MQFSQFSASPDAPNYVSHTAKSSLTADPFRDTHLRYYPIGYETYTCI